MKVVLASVTGFCDGVKHAMRVARDGAIRHGRLEAEGPLVHNDQAMRLLALQNFLAEPNRGSNAAASPGIGLSARPPACLIRAHGVAPEKRRQWEDEGRIVVDATCPRVANNQHIAAKAAEQGLEVILAGDREHAEVAAVSGSAGGACRVISTPGEAEAIDIGGPFLFLAQTTFDVPAFERMAAIFRRRFPQCRIADKSICHATHARQAEARRLAAVADALVVVGGANSANTRRLAEAGRESGKPVFQVESAAELRAGDFVGVRSVGVISGASTPGWTTQEVVNRLRFLGASRPAALFRRLLQHLVVSRIMVAFSTFGIGLAAGRYLTGQLQCGAAAAGALYLLFAHILNRRVPADPDVRQLTSADAYYQSHRAGFLALAWAAAAAALAIASRYGVRTVVFYSILVGVTIVYAGLWKHRATFFMRNFPVAMTNSRSVSMAVGWAFALTGPYVIAFAPAASGAVAMIVIFLYCVGLTGVRDLNDVSGDWLMGLDTLPAAIGVRRARRISWSSFAAVVVVLLAPLGHAAMKGRVLSQEFVFALIIPFLVLAGMALLGQVVRSGHRDAVLLQAKVDAIGIAMGVVAVGVEALP